MPIDICEVYNENDSYLKESDLMKLGEVEVGKSSLVKKVIPPMGRPDLGGQLEDIGFLPGEHVTVLRKGLVKGGPFLVRIGVSVFALRPSEAQMIEVDPVKT